MQFAPERGEMRCRTTLALWLCALGFALTVVFVLMVNPYWLGLLVRLGEDRVPLW
jgi:hypothetical protein